MIDGYCSVVIENLQDIAIADLNQILGIFKSKKEVKGFLLSVAKEFNLCPKLLGIEKATKACFNYHLGACFGACSQKEIALKYNLRFEEAFYKTKVKEWPFKGPIAIREKSQKEELFVIDQWCVLGSIKDEAQTLADISQDYFFDTDTYKILNRYLNGKRDFEIFNISSL
jgi:DNA polymerase III subunit epsilon